MLSGDPAGGHVICDIPTRSSIPLTRDPMCTHGPDVNVSVVELHVAWAPSSTRLAIYINTNHINSLMQAAEQCYMCFPPPQSTWPSCGLKATGNAGWVTTHSLPGALAP